MAGTEAATDRAGRPSSPAGSFARPSGAGPPDGPAPHEVRVGESRGARAISSGGCGGQYGLPGVSLHAWPPVTTNVFGLCQSGSSGKPSGRDTANLQVRSRWRDHRPERPGGPARSHRGRPRHLRRPPVATARGTILVSPEGPPSVGSRWTLRPVRDPRRSGRRAAVQLILSDKGKPRWREGCRITIFRGKTGAAIRGARPASRQNRSRHHRPDDPVRAGRDAPRRYGLREIDPAELADFNEAKAGPITGVPPPGLTPRSLRMRRECRGRPAGPLDFSLHRKSLILGGRARTTARCRGRSSGDLVIMATVSILLRIGPADQGRTMTLQEFLEAEEEEGYRYELARGVLEVSEVPNDLHGVIVSNFTPGSPLSPRPPRLHLSVRRRNDSGSAPRHGLGPQSRPRRRPTRCPKDCRGRGSPPGLRGRVEGSEVTRAGLLTKRAECLAYGLLEYWIVDPWRRS